MKPLFQDNLRRAGQAAALVIALAACGDESAPSERAPRETDRSAASDPEADRAALQALPYAGYVGDDEEDPDAEQDDGRSGVVKHDVERSYPGYNLYSVFRLAGAHLIDADGETVHAWEDPDGYHWARCELLPDGDLFVIGSSRSPGKGRGIADELRYVGRVAWDGQFRWKQNLPVHHDADFLPDGRILVLGFQYRDEPAVHKKARLRDDDILVLSAEGELLEQISFYDVLAASPKDVFTLQDVEAKERKRAFEVELFHSNSIERMRRADLFERSPIYAPNNVLLSMRHQDAIAIVDLETRETVWGWGQGELLGPHSAHVLDNGNILVFDNGLGRGWSRSVELDPLTKEIVWEYRAPKPQNFFSASRGSNQRLPNGNTLITESDRGRAFEVTPDGDVVWRFLSPHFGASGKRATIVRTIRYETDYVDGILDRFSDE